MFSQRQGLDFGAVREEIGFPILRENLISEDHEVGAGKDSLIRQDSMQTIGIISKRRNLLPYTDIMDWTVEGIDQAGVEFKLIDSVITRKCDLFQKYLFNLELDNPDSESISPMAIVKVSYVGKPLEMLFGTYRYVCSNGAIVGNTISSIVVKSRDLNDLSRFSIADDIKENVASMRRVSEKYSELSGESFGEYLNKMIQDRTFPLGIKREALTKLYQEKVIDMNIGDDVEVKKRHFNEDSSIDYSIVGGKSAWNFYNDLTEISTHRTRSVSAESRSSMLIGELFSL